MAIPRVPLGSGHGVSNPYPRRMLSCWHLLSAIMTVASTIFASYLLMKNVVFYLDVDHVVEHCTIDWESYYPCHFMHLWWIMNDQNSIYDLRCFLGTIFLFTMVTSAHYIVAGLAMVVGTARRSHLAMVPWLVVKAFVIILIAGLVLAEVYTTGGSIHSQYFMITIAILVCSVFHWIFGYVAFSQLRQTNLRLEELNNFNYIRFAN